MKSNVCKIENGTKDLAAILRESEKVAVYNELTHKQTLQLRLICEEIDGMLPNIIDDFEGELWIDFEDGVCQVNVSLRFDKFTPEKKKGLVGISKSKKNAAAVGIVGKIRNAIENFFLNEELIDTLALSAGAFGVPAGYYEGMDCDYLWRLDEYRSSIKKEAEAWDELEKSVIASVADDVIVAVKGNRAEIVIVKKFA